MSEEILTFENGMHTENDVLSQPKGTYRYLEHGLLISKNGTSYSVEYMKGNKVSFELFLPNFQPIHAVNINNKVYIISSNTYGLPGGALDISEVVINNDGSGTLKQIYYNEDCNITLSCSIDGYGYYENSEIGRYNWTDFINNPRSLNVLDPYIRDNVSTLVNGTDYMVVNGVVTYNAVNYGPGEVAGNIITANATPNYVVASGTPTVCLLLNENSLNYNPKFNLGNLSFERWIAGGLPAGSKMYCYRLFSAGDSVTPCSPISTPVHVSPESGQNTVVYQNVQGGSKNAEENTINGVQIKIEGIDDRFEKIELICVEANLDTNTISRIYRVFKGDITGDTMYIDHKTIGDIEYTSDDISLFLAPIEKCKTLTANKGFAFIANIYERPEFQEQITATISDFSYAIPGDTSGTVSVHGPGGVPVAGHDIAYYPIPSATPNMIHYTGKYKVLTGSVTYEGNVYNAGDYFTGVHETGTGTASQFTGAGTVVAVIRYKKYDKFGGGSEYNEYTYVTDFYDYKGLLATKHLRSYWRDETYRFGILPFDLYGNPMYVRHLGDFRTSKQHQSGTFIKPAFNTIQGTANALQVALQPLGIQIDNLDLTDIIDEISGFAIVRCPRDISIYAQGLLFPTAIGTSPNTTKPLASYAGAYDQEFTANGHRPNVFNFYSPDFMNLYSANYPGFKTNDQIEVVMQVKPLYNTLLTANQASITVAEEFYSKFYAQIQYNGPNATVVTEPVYCAPVGAVMYEGDIVFTNRDVYIDGHPGIAAGARGSDHLANWILKLDQENFANSYDPLEPLTHPDQIDKLIVNYVRRKTAPYGGTSNESLASSLYQFCGHYQPINATVKADIFDSGNNTYIFNGIQLFGGDCFINFFDCVKAGFNGAGYGNSYSYGFVVPLESSSNYSLRQGRHFGKDFFHNSTNGVSVEKGQLEEHIYNNAYTTDNAKIFYPSLPAEFQYNTEYSYRGRYSEFKTPGELVDSFKRFKVNNYNDVDAKLGAITKIAFGNDKLFYVQENGVGYWPVLEREVISSESGNALNVGVGQIMQRYDTINDYFGTKHLASFGKGSSYMWWFDISRKALVMMDYGANINEISFTDGLFDTFFREIFPLEENYSADTLSLLENDLPYLFRGVISGYDPAHKLAITSFLIYDVDREKNYSFAVVYDERRRFVSYIKAVPTWMHYIKDLFFTARHKAYDFNPVSNMQVELYDVYTVDNTNYVANTEFVTDILNDPTPDNDTRFTVSNNTNAIYVNWKDHPGRFFEVGYPFKFDVIIKGNPTAQKVFDNIERVENDTMIQEITYSNSEQIITEEIRTTDRNYRYFRGAWYNNIPFYKRERFFDHYLKIRFVFRSFEKTNIGVTLDKVKRIFSLKGIFRYVK